MMTAIALVSMVLAQPRPPALSGSGTANQVMVYRSARVAKGDGNLTWNGTNLFVDGGVLFSDNTTLTSATVNMSSLSGNTLTGSSSLTLNSTAGNNITIDSAGAGAATISIGPTNATTTAIGRSGQTVNLLGNNNLGQDQTNFLHVVGAGSGGGPTLQAQGGDATIAIAITTKNGGGIYLDNSLADFLVATSGASGATLDTNAGTMTIGGTHATTMTVGRSGQAVTLSSNVTLGGGFRGSRTTVADAAYAALSSDYLIAYTSITAARTVTLPAGAAGNSVQEYIIKDESGSVTGTNKIIVQPASGTIDGAASSSITVGYGVLRVYSNGTNWFTY